MSDVNRYRVHSSALHRDWPAGWHDVVLASDYEAELVQWCTWGTIEIAVRNPNVASYMEHWEGRATKAETERDALRAALEDARKICRAAPYRGTAYAVLQVLDAALCAALAAKGEKP